MPHAKPWSSIAFRGWRFKSCDSCCETDREDSYIVCLPSLAATEAFQKALYTEGCWDFARVCLCLFAIRSSCLQPERGCPQVEGFLRKLKQVPGMARCCGCCSRDQCISGLGKFSGLGLHCSLKETSQCQKKEEKIQWMG